MVSGSILTILIFKVRSIATTWEASHVVWKSWIWVRGGRTGKESARGDRMLGIRRWYSSSAIKMGDAAAERCSSETVRLITISFQRRWTLAAGDVCTTYNRGIRHRSCLARGQRCRPGRIFMTILWSSIVNSRDDRRGRGKER
jgi:hypothetical protein